MRTGVLGVGCCGFFWRTYGAHRHDGEIPGVKTPIPGTSCVATIVLSLRDKSHSPIEALDNYLSAYGVYPGKSNPAPIPAFLVMLKV